MDITDITESIDAGLIPDSSITPDRQCVLETEILEQLDEAVGEGWYTQEEADEYMIEYRKRFFGGK